MTLAIGHRGEPLGHCENTLESFRAAVRLGADMVEIDCRLSADGHVAVVHDPTLERIWGDPRAVAELTWEEIASLRADGTGGADGSGGEPVAIPDLDAVLAAVEVPIMVDLPEPAAVDAVLEAVARCSAGARCLFVGAIESLRRVRHLDPGARIGLTWPEQEPPSAALLAELKVEYFNPYWALSGPGVVRAHHDAGRLVSAWTVDKEADMRACCDWGIDAIVTNRLADLLGVLGRTGGAS